MLDFRKKFVAFLIIKREFVTGCFSTFFDTDYTGMFRELFNAL